MIKNTTFKTIFLTGFFLLSLNFPVSAQKKKAEDKTSCKLGDVAFVCPGDFKQIETIGKDTILFKSIDTELVTYLFVSIPGSAAAEQKAQESIAKNMVSDGSKKFVWKEIKTPLLMSLQSAYLKGASGARGFDGGVLINFTTRRFLFKDRDIYIGYAYQMDVINPKIYFEKELGGENAVGCNAVATLFNSISKESKDKEQYCYLMSISQ